MQNAAAISNTAYKYSSPITQPNFNNTTINTSYKTLNSNAAAKPKISLNPKTFTYKNLSFYKILGAAKYAPFINLTHNFMPVFSLSRAFMSNTQSALNSGKLYAINSNFSFKKSKLTFINSSADKAHKTIFAFDNFNIFLANSGPHINSNICHL
jgi:hypothetical protein